MAEQWIVDDIKRRFPDFDWLSVPPLDSISDVFCAYGLKIDSGENAYGLMSGIMSDEYETEEEAKEAAEEMRKRPNVVSVRVVRHKQDRAEFIVLCRSIIEKDKRENAE